MTGEGAQYTVPFTKSRLCALRLTESNDAERGCERPEAARIRQLFPVPCSGVNAALPHDLGDPIDGQHVAGRAVVDLVLLRIADHIIERFNHDVVEPFVHHRFSPEIALAILHPFEV